MKAATQSSSLEAVVAAVAAHEPHRLACEARYVLGLDDDGPRQWYLGQVEAKRGRAAGFALRDAVSRLQGLAKDARQGQNPALQGDLPI